MDVFIPHFFPYSLVKKRAHEIKIGKRWTMGQQRKKTLYIFRYLCSSIESFKARKAFASFSICSTYSFIFFFLVFFDTRIWRSIKSLLHKSKTHKKTSPFRSFMLLIEQGDIRKAQWYLLFFETFTWLMFPIALMFIFFRTSIPPHFVYNSIKNGREKNHWKYMLNLKIYKIHRNRAQTNTKRWWWRWWCQWWWAGPTQTIYLRESVLFFDCIKSHHGAHPKYLSQFLYCVILRFSIIISPLTAQAMVSFFIVFPCSSLSIDKNRLKL